MNALQEKTTRIGYHTNFYKSFLATITYAHEKIDASAVQLFIGNPKTYACSTVYEPLVKPYVESNDIFLISHSPYILNFARPKNAQAVNRYISDLKNISHLGGYGSVLHMGYNVLKDESVNRTFIQNLDDVLTEVPQDVIVILENMSGKGTAMCCKIDEWSEFCNEIPEDMAKRIEWCVDTAHLHGVGEYNLSMRREVMRFYEDFNNLIGWDKICCFHFNNSRADLGSFKDLHADISDGNVDTKGMRHLARLANQTGKPLIMEVPGVSYPVSWQVQQIKSWINPEHFINLL